MSLRHSVLSALASPADDGHSIEEILAGMAGKHPVDVPTRDPVLRVLLVLAALGRSGHVAAIPRGPKGADETVAMSRWRITLKGRSAI